MSNQLTFRYRTEDKYDLNLMTTQGGRSFITINKHRLPQEDLEALLPVLSNVRWLRTGNEKTGFISGRLNLGADISVTYFSMEGCTEEEAQNILKEKTHA